MQSPLANLYLALQERILAEVPEIQYIDQNLGQYMNGEFRKQMLFPCVLIDFPNTDFSALQGNYQFAELTIVVTVFYDIWNHTNSLAPNEIKEAGLQYLDIDQKVFRTLQGWNPNFCEALTRAKYKSHNANEMGLVVRETTFLTQYEDYSNNDNWLREWLGIGVPLMFIHWR